MGGNLQISPLSFYVFCVRTSASPLTALLPRPRALCVTRLIRQRRRPYAQEVLCALFRVPLFLSARVVRAPFNDGYQVQLRGGRVLRRGLVLLHCA